MSTSIRLAIVADAIRLPALEQSASTRFLEIADLASLPDEENLSVEAHRHYTRLGTEWVAVHEARRLVGFLAAEIISSDLHIWELAVQLEYQGRGIGRRLVETALDAARAQQLQSVTLTTFTDVPWNAPWYSRLGFQVDRSDRRLATIVQGELARGLPRRCAMRKKLTAQPPARPTPL